MRRPQGSPWVPDSHLRSGSYGRKLGCVPSSCMCSTSPLCSILCVTVTSHACYHKAALVGWEAITDHCWGWVFFLLWSCCLCRRVLLLLCHSRRGAFIWPACAHAQYQSGCSQQQFNICGLLFSDSRSSTMSPCHFGTCLARVGLQWLVLYRGSARSAVYRLHLW